MNEKVKIGLMLGGGGAKGSYQLGVIRALEEARLLKYVKSISGTSIGAINTLLLMSRKNHKQLSIIWEMIDKENIFGDNKTSLTKDKRLYSLEPLANRLIEQIDIKSIKKSKYHGYATAALMYDKLSLIHQIKTDTMEKKVFNLKEEKDPYKAVMASASIPVLFGPTKIDDKNYVDGGMLDNYPMTPLINDGCNLIFAVALDDRFNPYLYDHTNVNIIDFTAQKAFEKNILKDMVDMMRFNQRFKDDLESIGYLVGQIMIKKMFDERYITKIFGFNNFYKRPEFKVLALSKTDEVYVRRMKLSHKKVNKLNK